MSKVVEKAKAKSKALLNTLLNSGSIKDTAILTDSTIYNISDMIPTPVPALNIALSGSINGGLSPGILMIAGPSKHFKSLLALIMAKSYLDKHPEGFILFYDNEFGAPISYFESLGIDPARIIHKPLKNIEELKHDIAQTLAALERGNEVMILVDSIGNIASKKEVEDAEAGKSAADMTRAKQLKSFFRIVTPYMKILDIPLVVINHIYMEQSLFPKAIVSGGTGGYYSANDIWIIGRQQDKAMVAGKKELQGYNFTINIEKSRFVKEKSKINFLVKNASGIDYYSNLLDVALHGGFIDKPVAGKYVMTDAEGNHVGEIVKEKDVRLLLREVIKNPEFDKHCLSMYKLAEGMKLIADAEDDDIVDEDDNEDNTVGLIPGLDDE